MSNVNSDLIEKFLKSKKRENVLIPTGDFFLKLVKSKIIENFRVDIQVSIIFQNSDVIENEVVPLFENKKGYKRGFNLWRGSGKIGTGTFVLSPYDKLADPDWTVHHNEFLTGQKLTADDFTHISLFRMESFLVSILNHLGDTAFFYDSIRKNCDVSRNLYLIEPLAYLVYFGGILGLENAIILKELMRFNPDLEPSEVQGIINTVKRKI